MSSDNGIYILKTRAHEPQIDSDFEYRVAHGQAIENIYWDHEKGGYREDQKFTPEIAFEYFSDAPMFRTLYEASGYAHQLESDYSILEYGVSVLEHGDQLFESFSEEALEAFEARNDALLEEHRQERDRQVREDLARRTITVPSGTYVTLRSGFIEFQSPDWDGDKPETQKMLRGRITGPITIELSDDTEVLKDE